jgi:hypothetical protein
VNEVSKWTQRRGKGSGEKAWGRFCKTMSVLYSKKQKVYSSCKEDGVFPWRKDWENRGFPRSLGRPASSGYLQQKTACGGFLLSCLLFTP